MTATRGGPRWMRRVTAGLSAVAAVLVLLAAGAALPALRSGSADPLPVDEKGKRLAALLDRMDVEHRWQPGRRVDWRTGEEDSEAAPLKSHCSAFAAAACARAGIYILRPPAHSESLLANAQCEWLRSAGRSEGWTRLADGIEAQRLANQGVVVVACYRNPDTDDAGHIAVVRPASKSRMAIAQEGPDVTQAGHRNYFRTSVRNGFRFHPGAWERGRIRYYAHPPGRNRGIL